MSISELTSRSAVFKAIEEFDALTRDVFLEQHGFHRSTGVFFREGGRRYDARAIAAVAYGHQFPDRPRLVDDPTYTGGRRTAGSALTGLGFVLDPPRSPAVLPDLDRGREYSWGELGDLFDFSPEYFRTAGGMLSRPAMGALLLITHPEGGRSFDFEDYPDGEDLIYAGRGLFGDQTLNGQNLLVAENSRTVLLFEKTEEQVLRFLDEVACVEHWETVAPDMNGEDRRVFRFRLRPKGDGQPLGEGAPPRRGPLGGHRAASSFRRRPFYPAWTSPPRRPGRTPDPDRQRVLAEQADEVHQAILRELGLWLASDGWTDIEEMPGGVDLLASRGGRDHERVLFEVKGVSGGERSQVRGGLAQLLEYQLFLGRPDDLLCLVTDAPISDRRLQLLDSLGIGHLFMDGGAAHVSGTSSSRRIFPTEDSPDDA